jgi:hypothetical protein
MTKLRAYLKDLWNALRGKGPSTQGGGGPTPPDK